MIKFVWEFSNGKGTYDSTKNRGYYADNFVGNHSGYYSKKGAYADYIQKDENKNWSLTLHGKKKMKELYDKLIKINPVLFKEKFEIK